MELKFTKTTPILFWIIAVLILVTVHPVKAEEQFNQTLFFSGGGSQYDTGSQTDVNNTPLGYQGINNISSIDVNFNNVKILSELKFFGTYDNVGDVVKTGASGIMSQYTNFDAYINGTYYGSGQIGWYRQTFIVAETPIYYRIIFDNVDTTYANSLTGIKNMRFSYDNTVYDDTIIPVGVCAGSMPGYTGTFTYVRIFIENSCHNKYSNIIQNNANDQYVGFSFYSTYILSFYNISNVAGWLNLTKFSSNAELTITNSTGTHIFDNTTTANEHLYQLKSQGLNANVKDVVSGQWSNWTIINSSGVFCYPVCIPLIPAPTPPAGGNFNPPLTIPSTGGSIQFNQTKYVVGDSPSIEWAISNAEWGCFFCSAWLIEIKDDNGNTVAGRWALGSQTGNRSILSHQTGTWTATLTKGALFPEIMGTATTVIQSSANTEDTIFTNKAVYNTTDIITVTGYKLSPYPGWIAISPYDSPYNYVRTYGTTVDFTGITGGTLLGNYTYSTALPEGKYLAQLHIGSGISPAIKEVIFNVNSSGNFAIYWVSADQFGNHFLPGFTGEFFDIRYSSKTQSDIVSVTSPKGITYDTWTVSNYPGEHQIFITGSTDNLGTWTAKIQNASNVSDYSTGLITLIQPGTIGTNNNVTLTWTPSTIVQKNHAILSWYVNNISNYRIFVSGGSANTIFSNQTYVNTASGSLDFVFQNVGSYYAVMTNETDGSLLKQVVLTVTSSVPSAPTPTSTGGAGTGTSDQWGKNLLAFLGMPAFWGLAIFLVGLYVAGQAGTRAQQAIPYVAFILLNIEAAFGLWVPFTMYILAVIWIGAGLVGVFGGLLKR